MTPIERVARCIARMRVEFQYGTACTDSDRASWEQDWRDYLPDARTILQVIREPSEAMTDAAMDRDKLGYDPVPSAVWEFMIDAALAEGG